MSQRSLRRLGAVAGAALALGAMSPALAAHVSATADPTVSVTPGADVTDLTLPSVHDSLPLGLATSTAEALHSTAHTAGGLLLEDVHDIVGDAIALPYGVLDGGLGADAGAGAGAGIGLGGVHVAVVGGSDLLAPVGLASAGDLVGDAFDAVGDARAIARSAAATTRYATGAAVLTAAGVPGTAFTTAGPILGTASGILFGSSADVNVVAGVLASL